MKIHEQNMYTQLNHATYHPENSLSVDSLPSLPFHPNALSSQNTEKSRSDGEVVATLETTVHIQPSKNKGFLYNREQISSPLKTETELKGTKLRPTDYYQNMLRTETEMLTNNNLSVSDEQLDKFLKKAFKLFNSPNPYY